LARCLVVNRWNAFAIHLCIDASHGVHRRPVRPRGDHDTGEAELACVTVPEFTGVPWARIESSRPVVFGIPGATPRRPIGALRRGAADLPAVLREMPISGVDAAQGAKPGLLRASGREERFGRGIPGTRSLV